MAKSNKKSELLHLRVHLFFFWAAIICCVVVGPFYFLPGFNMQKLAQPLLVICASYLFVSGLYGLVTRTGIFAIDFQQDRQLTSITTLAFQTGKQAVKRSLYNIFCGVLIVIVLWLFLSR